MANYLRVHLPAETRSASKARRAISEFLAEVPLEEWVEPMVLAVSEVVTNAVVHSGSAVSLEAWATADGVRVEVSDASAQLPVRRGYAVTSGTGRGLHLLDNYVDRWGSDLRPPGKVVWFELGEPSASAGSLSATPSTPATPDSHVRITLLHVPILMHWAWQEHAQTLLREYLLFALDSDPDALEHHAHASEALSILYGQVPLPKLPDDPDQLLADAVEPGVTAERVLVSIPQSSVTHFATLQQMLSRASHAASQGRFLAPPSQPEIAEMRSWICEEVARQSERNDDQPRPWVAQTDVRVRLADEETLRARYQTLSEAGEAILVTDEASVIVAATPPVVAFLGYESASELLGRRVIVVIPRRYHQAHIAGTTLNATNGREPLLDVPLTVPLVRADGSEVPVELRVTPRRLNGDHRVFVASLNLP